MVKKYYDDKNCNAIGDDDSESDLKETKYKSLKQNHVESSFRGTEGGSSSSVILNESDFLNSLVHKYLRSINEDFAQEFFKEYQFSCDRFENCEDISLQQVVRQYADGQIAIIHHRLKKLETVRTTLQEDQLIFDETIAAQIEAIDELRSNFDKLLCYHQKIFGC